MNWRRGLLRLWLVLSLCWIVVVGLYAWAQQPGDAAWSCFEVEQTTGANEFVCSRGETFHQSDPVTLKVGDQRVKIDRRFLQLSPEEQNQKVEEIAKALSLKDTLTTATIATIKEYAPYALLPPLVTLVLGLLGAWVVSGFARRGT
jgi:hypothetical protein